MSICWYIVAVKGRRHKMNQPLKHHYLPVFYLRRWVGEDGRLVRYHRPPGRPDGKVVTSRVSPDYTGFGEQLYTLHGASAPQMIETDFFSPVDNAAAPILDHLIAHGPASLDKTQRWYLARFVHSLQLRGPILSPRSTPLSSGIYGKTLNG